MRPVVGITCNAVVHDGMLKHRAGDEYVVAIRDGAGASPLLIPAAGLPPDEILARVDGLLFTGAVSNVEPRHYGGEAPRPGTLLDPARDATTLPLLRAAIAAGKPVLCICRGFQELNVALGGTLHQHVQEMAGRLDHRERPGVTVDQEYAPTHAVHFTPGGLLARLTGAPEATVNSLHQQGVDRLAPGLVLEAVAADGQIEAASGSGPGFLLGVQWHPEWRWAEHSISRAIFSAFGGTLG